MLDKFTIIRSVDCPAQQPRAEHGLPDRQPRRRAAHQPRGRHVPGHRLDRRQASRRRTTRPCRRTSRSCSRGRTWPSRGYLGKQYDPFIANQAARLPVYDHRRQRHRHDDRRRPVPACRPACRRTGIDDRRALLQQLRPPARRARPPRLDGRDGPLRPAGGRDARSAAAAREALRPRRSEPAATRDRYGKHLWCQQALLARRLVEAGVAFVTIDLSYHTASGTWDTHGDNIPPYGGIRNGLRPAAAAVRPPDHDAGRRSRASAACSTTCW